MNTHTYCMVRGFGGDCHTEWHKLPTIFPESLQGYTKRNQGTTTMQDTIKKYSYTKLCFLVS